MSAQFRKWVTEHQDQVWTLGRYLLKDAAEAEDVAQEAFVKLWNHQDRIDPEKIRPWLMQVTRNACLDRLRRRKPEQPVEDTPLSDTGLGPAQDVERSQLGRTLQRAIRSLAEPYRSLVVMRDIQQHSYNEVATVMGLSLSQVKVYLHRARKQLREQLAEVAP